jgi:hypothetical protein
MVANIIEKDLKQIAVGDMARVEVDAFPGEDFMGRIARVSPVLDPSTRTAPLEVEISNPQYRLKPGMYARVRHHHRVASQRARRADQRGGGRERYNAACTCRSTTWRRFIR